MTTTEDQRIEAIKRIKAFNLHPNVLKEFKEEGKLNYSEKAVLYWLDDEMSKYVKEFETEHNAIVYHVIKNNTEFGTLLSFLYVSQFPDEWGMDWLDLQDGYQLVYVKNLDSDICSEFGTIGVRPCMGGLIRSV